MEVYINDILVKSTHAGDHFQHSDTFEILRKHNMKLNPEKCAFGVASGKILGFLVSNRDIEVNHVQIKAIKEIPEILKSKKEVQILSGRIAALGRFISKSSEKSFKFFLVLKKHNQFEWTDECQQTLKDLKLYLSNPLLLAKQKDDERLLIYLAVSEVAPKTAIKSQFLADFSMNLVPEAEKELPVFTKSNPGIWTLFTNGYSNIKGAGLGIVLTPPSGEVIRQAIKCYPITNNEAEYEAVIAGLELLVVNQMQGNYMAREARMKQYLEKVRELLRQFQSWKAVQIPREENAELDALANLAPVTNVINAENAIVIHLFHSALDQDKSEIKQITSAPYHPAANGQAESINKVIINNLKKRLEESKGKWPEVLPGVLWAYRTTTKTSTGETPFLLVYGAEALIPIVIGEPSTRYTHLTEEANKKEMRVDLDLLEERREASLIRMAAQKQMIERYYNRKANLRYFKIGDFVLKKVFRSTKVANAGKWSPNWEGPYRVRGIAGKGAYELETMDGKVLPSNWNAVHLKKYNF
ncbi:uncharacterized protein [Nicotiana tomentosiformis]|uniref:uncharacterized protein n=1 Tax=Nicotiana tomentosiformis TaxID=4098 RepID=UPI00388C49B4